MSKRFILCGSIYRWVGILTALFVVASEAEQIASCDQTSSDKLLACVGTMVETLPTNGRAILAEPLHGYLNTLAQKESYSGALADLQKLKDSSANLKALDPLLNRDAITALDNAIASHNGEIRAAVSFRGAAQQALHEKRSPGTNIHRLYVQRKLSFLDTSRAEIYDRGPFEIARRSLLANALEESYFLDRSRSKLEKEIQVLNELQSVYDNPPGYLSIPQINLHRNSNLFWLASILFVLHDRPQSSDILRRLAVGNNKFGLETENPGHVYSYRILDLPYDIRLLAHDSRSGSEIKVNDPGVVNRFYNPAQLALVACSQLDGDIDNFIAATTDLVFYDYYVVVALAPSIESIQSFRTAVEQTINGEGLRASRDELIQRITQDSEGFQKLIVRGAQLCNVQDDDRKQIFTPFRFESTVEPHREGSGAYEQRLLVGGRLNANQATWVVDFLKREVYNSGDLKAQAKKLGVSIDPVIDRMKIDE
jgi:hypothetical protein